MFCFKCFMRLFRKEIRASFSLVQYCFIIATTWEFVILKDSYPALQNIFKKNQFEEHCNRESKINKNKNNLTSNSPILFNFFVKMLNKFGDHSSVSLFCTHLSLSLSLSLSPFFYKWWIDVWKYKENSVYLKVDS